MGLKRTAKRAVAASIAASILILGAMGIASAIESEGEYFENVRAVGNLGVATADIGVYPDRSLTNPLPERTTADSSITLPDGAEVVESLLYWIGRGPGWSDDTVVLNGVELVADREYSWRTPGPGQISYVKDLAAAGIDLAPGENPLAFESLDHNGERFFGLSVVVIYEHPSLPEIELSLLEGNEFAFFNSPYFDDVGNVSTHSAVSCASFPASLEDRPLDAYVHFSGVDAGRGDGPPRTQRLRWWSGTDAITAPVVNGSVGEVSIEPDGQVDNPVPTKVPATDEWGSVTYDLPADTVLPAGSTTFCNQALSVDIGDGVGASLSINNQAAHVPTVYRLGNLVWLDEDRDGMAEVGEPGIDGLEVQLWKTGSDEPLAVTETSDDGSYRFEGLLCGTYTVRIPAGQTGSIAGVETDLADLGLVSINSPNADDDLDNDNNGLASPAGGDVVTSIVTIGDCGEDGDFSNDASNEPTDEIDRKPGPDDDPDGGVYDDVRSNYSVDIGFVRPITPEVRGETETTTTTTIVPDTTEAPTTTAVPTTSITPEVKGETESRDELPRTGAESTVLFLAGLMAVALGAWFFTASAWLRPGGQRG